MTSHRNPAYAETVLKMSAYLVIVSNYVTDGVLGIMFDSAKRLGTAVFYGNNMIKTDPKAYLRTTAHEVGSSVQLTSRRWSKLIANGVTKYTIMNQTRIIQGPSGDGWPKAIGFKFGDHEKTHLSTHPIENVKPGGTAFYDCNAEHKGWGH